MARSRRWGRIALVAVPVLVLLLVGGPFLYTRVIAADPAPTLSLDPPAGSPPAGSPAPGAAGSDRVDGTWAVAAGSQAGYRVDEVLFGQDVTAVGRTDRVTGTVTLAGGTVRTAEFSVDMASVTSDRSMRDEVFRGRLMDVATHPTATFRLRQPIPGSAVPAVGEQRSVTAAGTLTLRGSSRDVTVRLDVRRTADGVTVAGNVPVRFADYGIPDPSVGPIRTEDNGVLEFRLELRRP